jgi:hypothetical protein
MLWWGLPVGLRWIRADDSRIVITDRQVALDLLVAPAYREDRQGSFFVRVSFITLNLTQASFTSLPLLFADFHILIEIRVGYGYQWCQVV